MIPVYISHATPHTLRQSDFIKQVKESFFRHDIVCDNIYTTDNSGLLYAIRGRIKECFGIVVVAYERKYIETEIKKRGANIPGVFPQKLSDVIETTPFVQIEMSMAFAYDLPILVLKQKELLCEGVLDESFFGIERFDFDLFDSTLFDNFERIDAIHKFIEKVKSNYRKNG